MPATRVRHTLSSSTSRTCTSEGEELAIAFSAYATSLDVWESNRRLSHERRLTRRRRRRPHASAPRRMPLPYPMCAVGVAAPNPRVFVRAASAAHLRCVSSPRGVRPHTQNGRSFTGTFFSFEQTTWHGQLLGLRFPVSRLCAVVVSALLEWVFFYFNSFSKNRQLMSPVAWEKPATIL